MNAGEFVQKWATAKGSERGQSQEHFIDLCRLLAEKTPTEADPSRSFYTFEQGALTPDGDGFADVWLKPMRAKAKSGDATGVPWWIHQRPRPDMRKALKPLARYLATPNLTKYRFFVWLPIEALPDHQLIVFARDDDYFFGVLHSQAHEVCALRMGTQLENCPRYTPTTTFETFPFPDPSDAQRTAVAEAARELNALREAWLNPAPSMVCRFPASN